MSAALQLFPDPPAPRPAPTKGPRRFLCLICKRPVLVYGEPGAYPNDLCDSQECLLAWCATSAFVVPLLCRCPQRPYSHELKVHSSVRVESYNPKLKHRWPWSLMLSPRSEPSTERGSDV